MYALLEDHPHTTRLARAMHFKVTQSTQSRLASSGVGLDTRKTAKSAPSNAAPSPLRVEVPSYMARTSRR